MMMMKMMMKRKRKTSKVERSGLDFGRISPAKYHSISEYPHRYHQ